VKLAKSQQSFLILTGLLSVSFVFYWPTVGAGFVTDFIGWQERFDAGTFSDFLMCFGYPGLQQINCLIFYLLYKLFGLTGLPWYIIFSGLHALNAWLVYLLAIKTGSAFRINMKPIVALVASLIYLLNPYSVEVVVWKVCIHYLISSGLILTGLLFVLDYLESGRKKFLWVIHGLLFIALFTLELAFITPVLYLVLIGLMNTGKRPHHKVGSDLLLIVVPQALLVLSYLGLSKLLLGNWVGHYGTDAHLSFPVYNMISTEFQYLVKYLFHFRFTPYTIQDPVYQMLSTPIAAFFILFIGLSVLVIFIINFQRLSAKVKYSVFLLSGFFISILPVSNLFFAYLQLSENDRYGYLAFIFLAILLAYIFSLFHRSIFFFFAAAWLLISGFLTVQLIAGWQQSQQVYISLAENFEWYDSEQVYILNLPDNYRGIFMYRIIGKESGLPEVLQYRLGKQGIPKITDIMQYNMVNKKDGVSVQQTGPLSLKVEFNQWGNWWWRNGIGGSSYETNDYTVENMGHHYILTLKEMPDNAIFLYQDGPDWKQFHFSFE
jgi:hypothetical protein